MTMALNLMYITNNKEIATIAIDAGVDIIFVDMEYIGKEERQKGLDTVQSHHTLYDVSAMRSVTPEGKLLVRINPIHNETSVYRGTMREIDEVINAGADILMLPMFKTARDVDFFISCVGGRAKTMLLVETMEAVENIDEILNTDGINYIHIGLNDLHLAYGRKFMFELLSDGTVDAVVSKIRKKGIKYGFGGIARIGYGILPAEYIIAEHYRLGSSMAILSRSFCNADKIKNKQEVSELFKKGVFDIREYEKKISHFTDDQFADNHKQVQRLVEEIIKK